MCVRKPFTLEFHNLTLAEQSFKKMAFDLSLIMFLNKLTFDLQDQGGKKITTTCLLRIWYVGSVGGLKPPDAFTLDLAGHWRSRKEAQKLISLTFD